MGRGKMFAVSPNLGLRRRDMSEHLFTALAEFFRLNLHCIQAGDDAG